ncbi:Alpha/Beta hydrolase protein [Chlamydoabsidia padenii]|nr:Alpha/Beta hydrolase protein [Chlamydoabsidia padenii]
MESTHQQQQQQQQLYSPVTPKYRSPRKPIVLCHGLYGFDRMGPEGLPVLQVHYWNEIEKALCDLGAKVIVTRVPKTESISNRAYVLHSILDSFMAGKEVNMIAHSMGGLDCRYLVSHMKHRSYKVSSVSTVCTPHRGSSVMDWFRDKIGVGQQTTSAMITCSSLMGGDLSNTRRQSDKPETLRRSPPRLAQWFDTPAYSNLTTDYCTQHFNPTTPDDPSVAYYSYTAKSLPLGSSLLDLPGYWLQQAEGDNDGVVSVSSGKWGQHVKTIDDADHWDFTGKSVVPYRWRAKPSSHFDRSLFYVELANHLYEQGH